MFPLASNFRTALSLIEIDGRLRDFASDAHREIRELLEGDVVLARWGVDTVVIGSYARRTGIFPGKDVDVFTKLTRLRAADVEPITIYERVLKVLRDHYGDRVTAQPRSVKVSFDTHGYEFSVDAVPAVRYRSRWAIPRRDRGTWEDPDERWVETDPEVLTKLTSKRNRQPLVDGQGAYVPVVKLIRQTRSHHLGKAKPGGFYFELMTYWAFECGDASGDGFGAILATTLANIAGQLRTGAPVIDPVLGTPYKPSPEAGDLAAAAQLFGSLAERARTAVQAERCPAGAAWRQLLGLNERGWCFPLPDGCDADGRALQVVGAGASRPSREPGAFA